MTPDYKQQKKANIRDGSILCDFWICSVIVPLKTPEKLDFLSFCCHLRLCRYTKSRSSPKECQIDSYLLHFESVS